MRALAVFALLALPSCSPPVMFSVDVDEEIAGGTLTLNGSSARLERNADGTYWAKWDGSDASGQITLEYPDGSTARCEVGYVTHGIKEQRYQVVDRECEDQSFQ